MVHQDDPWIEKVSDSDVVDPLSGPARTERTGLLISNLVFFAIVHIGLVPQKIESMGLTVDNDDLKSDRVYLLIWIVLMYYLISFGLTVGAELRAWKSRLDALKERRQLRALWYLDRRLATPPEVEAAVPADDEGDESRRMRMIIASNQAQHRDWADYQRMYRLRMVLDGLFPIILTLANAGAAALRWIA
jgi:hypothetical protein